MVTGGGQYLTVTEAAGLLRTTSRAVTDACRRGQLRSIKVGKQRVIPADALRGNAGDADVLLVPFDGQLVAALAAARDATGTEASDEELTHDLAIDGARLASAEAESRDRAYERLSRPSEHGLRFNSEAIDEILRLRDE